MPIYLFLRTFRAPGLVGKCRAQFWDVKTGKELARLFYHVQSGDWLVIAPDHRYDGSKHGREILAYCNGDVRNDPPTFPPPSELYTPGLLNRILLSLEPLKRAEKAQPAS